MSPTLAIPRSYQYHPQFAPARPNARRREIQLRGLGDAADAQLAQQIGGLTGTVATGALSALALAHVIALSAAAIPLIGVGIAAITASVALILNSGCGQTCIVTSNWANDAERLLIQNIQQYFALPAPRSQSAKNVALANFDNVWNYLVKECGQAQLGTAGVNCTQDRMNGACKWQQRADSPLLQYPNEPQPGECWNWFNGYRDPIAMDAAVPDAVATPADSGGIGAGLTSIFQGADTQSLVLVGALGLLAVGLIGGLS